LAPRVRWNAPEKSYPPRSRRGAKEGRVAFWKKRAFLLLPPAARKIPAREETPCLPLRGYLSRDKDVDANVGEREEAEERGADLEGLSMDEERRACGRVCAALYVHVGLQRTARVEGRESECEGGKTRGGRRKGAR